MTIRRGSDSRSVPILSRCPSCRSADGVTYAGEFVVCFGCKWRRR